MDKQITGLKVSVKGGKRLLKRQMTAFKLLGVLNWQDGGPTDDEGEQLVWK